jgi:ABC-type antimicrobial peptide transport system permease subunit
MQDIIYNSESLSLRRPIVMLLAAFGSIALVLAIVGVYGVVSYFVTARTKESGIRMALGAEHGVVVGLVLREVSQLVLAGLMVGLVGALALTQLLPTGHIGWSGSGIFLYGVTRTDAVTYGGILLLLSSVAFVASYVPARRATKVDPIVALRYE